MANFTRMMYNYGIRFRLLVPVIMPVSPALVSPFFIGFMLVVPVIAVTFFMVVANKFLAVSDTPEMIKRFFVFGIMKIGLRFIYHFLMTMVKIKPPVLWRQFVRKCPMTTVHINKLVRRYIIITLDAGNIVIFYMIIARWSPRTAGHLY